MGVGKPDDIVGAVRARHRHVRLRAADALRAARPGLHARGALNMRNARHAEDPRPSTLNANCPASNTYSRAYLHHLVRAEEMLGLMLLTWHNLAYYQDLMAGLRKAIAEGRLDDHVRDVKEGWAKGERDGEADPMAHADNTASASLD